ncbi:hypothetical protein BDN72DRAFT_16118 [Pluteus cervinus]|uniref:Uncharacterized protein n=1 Tax=Pluteus cervinus TaxID=181527 RepID=A0ACD3BFJ3_9AGAR|nr:hypothetical protein BDN72DRAFT_16118 [Pluteus cervinus]
MNESAGFSIPQPTNTKQERRVVFITLMDNPTPPTRSSSTWYQWPTFAGVIFDSERFLRAPVQGQPVQTLLPPPSPPPSPTPTPPPPPPPSSSLTRTRKSQRLPPPMKDWSMKTIYSQDSVDEDILQYPQDALATSRAATAESTDRQDNMNGERDAIGVPHRRAVTVALRHIRRFVLRAKFWQKA